MKRKVLAMLLSASMLLSVAGCSKNDSDDRRDRDRDDDEQEETVIETEVPETEVEETRESRATETTVEETEAEEVSIERDGDYIIFGHYEQDNNLDNGPEPIEWEIVTEENGSMLLMSRYVLDSQPFDTTGEEVAWENCTLRTWLNDDFLNTAFSSAEQAYILPSSLPTGDMVFIFSPEELLQYYEYSDVVESPGSDYDEATSTTHEYTCAEYWFPSLVAHPTDYALSVPESFETQYLDYDLGAGELLSHGYTEDITLGTVSSFWLRQDVARVVAPYMWGDGAVVVYMYEDTDVLYGDGLMNFYNVGVRPVIYITAQ